MTKTKKTTENKSVHRTFRLTPALDAELDQVKQTLGISPAVLIREGVMLSLAKYRPLMAQDARA